MVKAVGINIWLSLGLGPRGFLYVDLKPGDEGYRVKGEGGRFGKFEGWFWNRVKCFVIVVTPPAF